MDICAEPSTKTKCVKRDILCSVYSVIVQKLFPLRLL